jgi:hypothetical protein
LTNKHLCGYANNTGVDFVTFNSATSEVLILEFLEIDITINLAAVSSTTAKFFVEVFRNDTLYSTTEIAPTLTGIAIKKVASTPIQAYEAENVPYKIFLYADEPVTCNASITFDQGLAGTFTKNVVSPIVLTSTVATALNSTIKVADFVSAIFKAFNLVCVGENETTFTIEPLQDWYSLGSEKDITKYVINSSNVKRLPLYKQIAFKYKESKSFINKNFLTIFNRQYGDLDYAFDYDGSEFKIELPFENTQFAEITGTNLFCSYCLDENNSGYIPEPQLMYLGGEETATSTVKFFDGTSNLNVTDYALFNSVNTTGFSLCFGNEFNIVTQETEPNSLYQTYYSNHLGNLYDLQQRLFSFTAMLPTGVLANLKMNDKIIIKDKRYLINDISSTLNNGEVKMNLIRELVTIAPDCECIKVTYTLVGGSPVTVEINKINVGYDLWQFVLEEEPNLISIDLYYNAGHWVLHFVTVTATTGTNGLYYAFVENEGCPFVDFSEYELQEGYELNLESFIVEPCY